MKYLFNHIEDVRLPIRASQRMYLLLDFDGTLTPIRSDPRKVKLSRHMSHVLHSLSIVPSCVVVIVSGRALRDVRRLVGINGIYYMGNHGLEISGKSVNYMNSAARNSQQGIRQISRSLRPLQTLGATIEDKKSALAVHFRRAPLRNIPRIKSFVTTILRPYPQFKTSNGKKVVEILPRTKWNKGTAVKWLIHQLGDGLPIYIGDDLTDEDAFQSLRGHVTILVSREWKASFAKYYLHDSKGVYKFLKLITTWVSLDAKMRNSSLLN